MNLEIGRDWQIEMSVHRYIYTMKPMIHTQAFFCTRLALFSIVDTVDDDCVSDTAPGNFVAVRFGLTQSLMPSTVRSSSDISSRGGGMSEDTATINLLVTESNFLKVLNFTELVLYKEQTEAILRIIIFYIKKKQLKYQNKTHLNDVIRRL